MLALLERGEGSAGVLPLTTEQAIPRGQWQWFGNAGHLIVGQDCRFHLATKVGDYLVSTVGEYLPDSSVRETIANSEGVVLNGKGDERRADYMRNVGWQNIGYGRKYETMVFRIGSYCNEEECHHCGIPIPADWGELDFEGYNDAGSATRGHYKMCDAWADPTQRAQKLLDSLA